MYCMYTVSTRTGGQAVSFVVVIENPAIVLPLPPWLILFAILLVLAKAGRVERIIRLLEILLELHLLGLASSDTRHLAPCTRVLPLRVLWFQNYPDLNGLDRC